MVDNDKVLSLSDRRSILSKDGPGAIHQIVETLKEQGIISDIPEFDGIELDYVDANERIVGRMLAEEKLAFALSVHLTEEIEFCIRENSAKYAEEVAEAMRDRSLSPTDIMKRFSSNNTDDNFNMASFSVMLFTNRLLSQLWSFSIRQRLSIWTGHVGVRSNWVIVRYD